MSEINATRFDKACFTLAKAILRETDGQWEPSICQASDIMNEVEPVILQLAETTLLARLSEKEQEVERLRKALTKPFCVLFLDGRNEHGSHVLSSYPRSFEPEPDQTNIEDEAETIISQAESLGFSVGEHVWAEFDWTPPQIDNEGRTEFTGYWEFKRINTEMTRSALNGGQ